MFVLLAKSVRRSGPFYSWFLNATDRDRERHANHNCSSTSTYLVVKLAATSTVASKRERKIFWFPSFLHAILCVETLTHHQYLSTSTIYLIHSLISHDRSPPPWESSTYLTRHTTINYTHNAHNLISLSICYRSIIPFTVVVELFSLYYKKTSVSVRPPPLDSPHSKQNIEAAAAATTTTASPYVCLCEDFQWILWKGLVVPVLPVQLDGQQE